MNTEVKIIAEPAETVYINTPKDSYGIFCFNSSGDLFLNSFFYFIVKLIFFSQIFFRYQKVKTPIDE